MHLAILFFLLSSSPTPKAEKCTPPPMKYGMLKLQDCHKDPKTGHFGCTYGLCMKDPIGQVWCGAMLLLRETCSGLFKPALMELVPQDSPDLPDNDSQAQKKPEGGGYDL